MKIRTNVDYKELSLFENHLVHELHRLSDAEFIKKYKNINEWCKSYEERALLTGVLQMVTRSTSAFKVDGYVLSYLDFLDYEDGELTDEDLEQLYDKAIPYFRGCGVLYSEFGGFADGTYYRDSVYK